MQPIHDSFLKEIASLLKQSKTTNLISRILFLNYHLSGHTITGMILLPTLDGDPICIRYLSEPLSTHPIHGITAPKVYPYKPLPVHIVSFYLTFSPFPPLPEVVIFCGTVSFPIAQEAGYSPVGCSVLSGLSFTQGVTIARVCSRAKI